MLPQCSHITKKRGVFYYRRRVSRTDVYETYGSELALSLRTKNYRCAEDRAHRLDRLFVRLVHRMSDRSKIAEVLRECLNKWIEKDREIWFKAPEGRPAYAYWADVAHHPLAADMFETEEELRRMRKEAARRDFGSYRSLADELIERHGLPRAATPEMAYGLLQVRVKVLEKRLQRLECGEPLDLATDQLAVLVAPSAPPSVSAEAPPAVPPTPLFSELARSFAEFAKTAKDNRGQTIAQAEATFRAFMQVCGDKPVGTYTNKDTGLFYDTLRKLPALWGKKPEWRKLSAPEIVKQTEGADVERLKMKTIKRHFSALGPLFDYAKQRGMYEGVNPAHGFKFPTKKRGERARKAWDREKLKTLFASPVWAGCHPYFRSKPGTGIVKDAKYWLPILGLFHGNRLEEFAQLRREDIGSEDGIWFFNLTDEDGRKLKNAQSRRRVPMHPTVIALGFLEHVNAAAPNADDNVFPELRAGGNDERLGYYITKWWGQYRKDVGVYEKGQDYHSFRHTVITELFSASVPQQHVELIAGHAGQGMSASVYRDAEQVPLRVLYDAICKLDWSEVSPLFKA